MESAINSLTQAIPFLGAVPLWVMQAVFMIVVAGVILGFALLYEGVASYIERKVAADIQVRIGPNRVGPNGWFQFIADGVKLLLKEDLIPAKADKFLFVLAPFCCFVGSFAAFVVVPFGIGLIAADLNIGVYYVIAVTSLVVIGILMAGWASNNKWALLGGMRAAAQIVSYEVPVGLALMPPILRRAAFLCRRSFRIRGGSSASSAGTSSTTPS